MNNSKLFLLLLAGCLLSLSAQAKLYKWVDEKGITHYGETIPAEFASRDRAELNKAGHIVNQQVVLTAEQRRVKEAVEVNNKAAQNALRDQKLHDSSLLNTYSSSKEIDLARTRNLQQLQARSQITIKQLNEAGKSLDALQKANYVQTQAGKPLSSFAKEDLQAAQINVDKLSKELATITSEKATLEARYDADKARYIELTGK